MAKQEDASVSYLFRDCSAANSCETSLVLVAKEAGEQRKREICTYLLDRIANYNYNNKGSQTRRHDIGLKQ